MFLSQEKVGFAPALVACLNSKQKFPSLISKTFDWTLKFILNQNWCIFSIYICFPDRSDNCQNFKDEAKDEVYPLEAYAVCLNSQSQFFYTIAFLILPLVFYLTEFITLTNDYEPTGLRQRIIVSIYSYINQHNWTQSVLLRN